MIRFILLILRHPGCHWKYKVFLLYRYVWLYIVDCVYYVGYKIICKKQIIIARLNSPVYVVLKKATKSSNNNTVICEVGFYDYKEEKIKHYNITPEMTSVEISNKIGGPYNGNAEK
jgi:hypothetical protein